MGGTAGGWDGSAGSAELHREYRGPAVAGCAQPEAYAGGVRRSEQVFAREVLRRAGCAGCRTRQAEYGERVAQVFAGYGEEREGRVGAGARCVVEVPVADRLWDHGIGSAEGGRADRCRDAD